jgi:hypothetical protein
MSATDDGEYDGAVCAQCGNAWFDAVVALTAKGDVAGWSNRLPTCSDCGAEWVPPRQRLSLVTAETDGHGPDKEATFSAEGGLLSRSRKSHGLRSWRRRRRDFPP